MLLQAEGIGVSSNLPACSALSTKGWQRLVCCCVWLEMILDSSIDWRVSQLVQCGISNRANHWVETTGCSLVHKSVLQCSHKTERHNKSTQYTVDWLQQHLTDLHTPDKVISNVKSSGVDR